MGIFSKKINKTVEETNEETVTTETNDNVAKIESDNSLIPSEEIKDNKSVELKPTTDDKPAFSKYSNIDFRKWSQRKMFEVIVELIMENKSLYQTVSKLNDEVMQYNGDVKEARKSTSDVSGKIDYIAQKICPSLIDKINDGNKFTLDAKVSIIIETILKEKRDYMNTILEKTQRIKEQKLVLDELKAQLTEQIDNNNKEILDDRREFSEKEFETFAGTTTATEENITSLKGSVALKAIDLEKARASVDNTCKKIMEGIGKEGISEYPLLLQYCLKANCGITESKFDTAISNLKTNSIVEVEQVQTINRIRGIRLFSLTNEVGKPLYKEMFREKAVLSEKEKIKRENDNLAHGYSIKDVVNQLEEFGYTEISMDRKTNTIPISGANTWVPDVIAINPISGRKEYFEVEMGSHNQTNFNLKMDKANLKASVLKIIVPNKIIAENVCRKVDDWRATNFKKTSTITIYVQRFTEFKNKEDGRVFAPADKIKASDIMNNEVIKTKPNKQKNQSNNSVKISTEEDDV